jgi:ribosomal protein S18 acetylase RimI-like enzyme
VTVSIGSLHTMEEHRKLGLGKIIIADLCRQFASRYPKYPLHKGDVLIHGDCEAYNDSAVAFFTKQGFGEVLYVSWTGVDI